MGELYYPLLSLSRLRMETDGVGVTTLIAGAGCPLRCRYCINKKLLSEAAAKPVTAEELLERVRVDDLYFRATGGGVTFGGGESLLHAAFIRAFRKICPPEWRIVVETSLAVPRELVELSLDSADAYIVDCKDMNPEIYRSYTGGDGLLMKNNLQYLLNTAGPARVIVRVPLIPDYNTPDDQAHSVKILKEMGAESFDLFDYVLR